MISENDEIQMSPATVEKNLTAVPEEQADPVDFNAHEGSDGAVAEEAPAEEEAPSE